MDDFPNDRRGRADAAGADPRAAASQVPAGGGDFDIVELLRSIWRQKLTVAVFGLAFGFLGIVLVYSLTPRYTASSTVMLDQNEDQVIDLESVVSGISADYFTILAEREVLRSRALAGRVVDSMNLTEEPLFNAELLPETEPPLPIALMNGAIEFVKTAVRGAVSEETRDPSDVLSEEYLARKRAIDALIEATEVASVNETFVYEIVITTTDPLMSAAIADKYAELYILDQLETKFEATQAATEWLSNRVVELKAELEASEAAVESYNSATTLISEQALVASSRQLKELRERRAELRSNVEDATARLERLEAARATGDRMRIAEVIGAPRLRDLAADIDAPDPRGPSTTREQRVQAFEGLASRLTDQIRIESERAAAQADAVGRSIAELETTLDSQSQDLVELRQLQREAEANRRIYEQFLRRLNETSVQVGVQQADARILSPAVITFDPSFPNKTMIVLLLGFVGGVIGIAFVVTLEQMNRSFRSSEELEKATGLAVLGGAIPSAPVRKRRSLLEYAAQRSSSALMEAIRNLRTGILLANVDRPPQVVMLTSSLPKEGKTTCSLLLSQNAAALGKKVLLIECDLRRRTFRSYFDAKDTSGLMTLLTGAKPFDEVVHHDETSGIDVVLGEASKVNAADVFSSQRFADVIAEARERYDFVVIDTPPVLAVPDARVIAPLVDAVIYCVRWNSTHKDLVSSGLAAFRQINVRVAGLALTQINLRKMASYGYGGYNYYYYKTSNRYYLN